MNQHPFSLPPACPYFDCRFHRAAPPDFWRPYGIYRSKGYPGGVRRFRCTHCFRTFSIRRFSVEFRLHKPRYTAFAIHELASAVSLRQAARAGVFCRESLERRLDRYGRHALLLLDRVTKSERPLSGRFLLDEAESFEGSRRERPVTIPILVHGKSRFLLALAVGTLPPRHRRAGCRRRNESAAAVRRCLRRLVRIAARGSSLLTDRKPSYAKILRALDPEGKLRHFTISSKRKRGVTSALFDVNHTLAMARDGIAKLRRQSWNHAKKRKRLLLHTALYALWRNFRRPRFNRDRTVTPAMYAGISDHRWTMRELVRWRLDLGAASISPLRPRHAS